MSNPSSEGPRLRDAGSIILGVLAIWGTLPLEMKIVVLGIVLKISQALQNGKSVHFLSLAFAWAIGVRTIIVMNALNITKIDTSIMGTMFYLLLVIAFWTLYKNIKKIGS